MLIGPAGEKLSLKHFHGILESMSRAQAKRKSPVFAGGPRGPETRARPAIAGEQKYFQRTSRAGGCFILFTQAKYARVLKGEGRRKYVVVAPYFSLLTSSEVKQLVAVRNEIFRAALNFCLRKQPIVKIVTTSRAHRAPVLWKTICL